MDKEDILLIILVIVIIALGLMAYFGRSTGFGEDELQRRGIEKCSLNNDTFEDAYCGDINCFYYCNNTIYSNDRIVWEREK